MCKSAKCLFCALCAALVFSSAAGGAETDARAPSSSAYAPRAGDARSRVYDFEGVGRRDGVLETGFERKTPETPDLDEKDGDGIVLSQGMRKFAEGAGKAIKNINEAALSVVSKPLGLLGLEAESAKLRPVDGGVGLGVSIKLDKKKKDAAKKSGEDGDDSRELYDLLRPDDSRGRM